MGHKRVLAPAEPPSAQALTAAMVGIGMNFAAEPAPTPNIEDTLFFASGEGMEHGDLRVASVLVTWLGVHLPWVNVDRLTRLVEARGGPRVRSFWRAVARWQRTDSRLRRLGRLRGAGRVDLLPVGTEFQVRRHGEDPRFTGGPLRVPANALRARLEDILMPRELATRNAVYRWRVIIGPTYRADMWAALEEEPNLTAAQLARYAYGSFSTAWHVRRDHAIVRGHRMQARRRAKREVPCASREP